MSTGEDSGQSPPSVNTSVNQSDLQEEEFQLSDPENGDAVTYSDSPQAEEVIQVEDLENADGSASIPNSTAAPSSVFDPSVTNAFRAWEAWLDAPDRGHPPSSMQPHPRALDGKASTGPLHAATNPANRMILEEAASGTTRGNSRLSLLPSSTPPKSSRLTRAEDSHELREWLKEYQQLKTA